MRGRGWDDPWQTYPASKPLKAEGGIATSKQRGAMADTWWSKRFVETLESYGLGTRMQRGRRYARTGQVLSIDVNPGLIVSQVQGSRRTPYVVTVRSEQPSDAEWARLDESLRSQVGFTARLLAGEVPTELEGACRDAGIDLFPVTWRSMQATCNCPDWENPCKHLAAVLYVFADQLDSDPWLLLAWRGRTREQVLELLTAGRSAGSHGAQSHGLPVWWPLRPGRGEQLQSRQPLSIAVPPVPAHRVLARLEPLDAEIAGTPITELLAAAYEVLEPR
ncbi:MAG TPA: SWIM zinc finger family protein [Ilumatobacteraceae bacterium]|nr:SWIM zinc finger family protein [Ilumatobacteraceae bacterium]